MFKFLIHFYCFEKTWRMALQLRKCWKPRLLFRKCALESLKSSICQTIPFCADILSCIVEYIPGNDLINSNSCRHNELFQSGVLLPSWRTRRVWTLALPQLYHLFLYFFKRYIHFLFFSNVTSIFPASASRSMSKHQLTCPSTVSMEGGSKYRLVK